MGALKNAGDLVGRLQEMRRKCDAQLRDRGKASKCLAELSALIQASQGDITAVRPLAAGLGDLWDTLVAVHAVAVAAVAAEGFEGGEGTSESLQPSHASLAPASAPPAERPWDLGGEDLPPDPDD